MLRLWGSGEDGPIMDDVGLRGDSTSSRVYPCAPLLHINSRKESNMRSHSPAYQLLRPEIASQLAYLILFNVRGSHGVGRIARTLTKEGNSAISNTRTRSKPLISKHRYFDCHSWSLADANEYPPANGIMQ